MHIPRHPDRFVDRHIGPNTRDVIGMVAGQGAKLAAIGLACGVAGALLLTRLMASMLFGVRSTNAGIFVLAGGALALVALAASLVPSLRAARVRPAVAIRHE